MHKYLAMSQRVILREIVPIGLPVRRLTSNKTNGFPALLGVKDQEETNWHQIQDWDDLVIDNMK